MGFLTEVGIGAVFFLHGAELSPQALRAGAANWRLHLFVHASTFVLFPAIGFCLFTGARGLLSDEARLGIFYLCALSSTISSSVAMTSLGRGNVPGAVFDATLSGLLGMVLTPLLMGLVSVAGAKPIPLGPAVLDVALKLLAPFAAGHLARPLIGALVRRYKPLVARADRSVIVLIVYGAFCDSTAAGLWSRYGAATIAQILVAVALLLALVLTVTTLGARAFGFSREDEVAAVFCGSKKSLANGAPIAKILFGASPSLGMIMLPLMLYHQLQLIVCSALARRYAALAEADAAGRAAQA
jgi:sodium/bile acid cotransporter 7